MITHNMTDAIKHGTRLIMMNEGRIILDISGEEKERITKEELLCRFAETAGVQEETDAVLGKVLQTASEHMKNGYSLADN